MNSAIYEGTVAHRRFRPRSHQLQYRVWYLLADLDELEELDRRVEGFGLERRDRTSFFARDHGPRNGSPLRPWMDRQLQEAGIDLEGGSIQLLAFPRIHGYAFNPLTAWFCHGPAGDLRALMFEVSNTFGEWHHYLVPISPDQIGNTVRVRFDKELFVSPFIDLEAAYDITVHLPDDRVGIAITVTTAEGRMLTATFRGRRLPLTSRTLRRTLRAHPLLTLKVIAGIHWEAVKLWIKGAPYRSRGAPPPAPLTIVGAGQRQQLAA